MAETVALWTWSPGWIAALGVIAGAATWSIGLSITRLRQALFRGNGLPVVRTAAVISSGVVLISGSTILFLLTQQFAFRFATVSVEGGEYIFRTPAGFEMARCSRNSPVEVRLVRDGKRSGYVIVREGDGPEVISIRSEDQLTLEGVRRFINQRSPR